jgi:hypothetical protein
MNDAYSNAHMVHLPVHASWLNQVEIYFSTVQRKALNPDDFLALDEVAEWLLSFQHHYNATAHPSTGPSPATTSTNCSRESAAMTARHLNHWWHDQPRRANGRDH